MAEPTAARPDRPDRPDRRALHARYLALRSPAGSLARLTPRAGRFGAAQRGCTDDFARLAARPVWAFDAALDRARFAEIVGLVAMRSALWLALDGAMLRRLAEHFGGDLVERALDLVDDIADAEPLSRSCVPADLRGIGCKLLDDAERGDRIARRTCECAWNLARNDSVAA